MKAELRREWRERLQSLSPVEYEARSQALAQKIQQYLSAHAKPGASIGGFRARAEQREAGLEAILQSSSALQFSLPIVTRSSSLEFRLVSLPLRDEEFVLSPWKIYEPRPDLPLVRPEQLEIIFVPLLAFDANGTRLGQGKGFYDRFLPSTKATRVGIAFSLQKSEQDLPREAHDMALDLVLTDQC